MAGPIVRQGIVQLGIEYQAPKYSAPPVPPGLTQQQKSAGEAVAKAAEAAAGSLELQRQAEEAIEALQARALETQKDVVQWKRFEEKQAQALADAVAMEAQSKALASSGNVEAAAKAQQLAAANLKIAESYQKAAMGALTMVRGAALLAGAENESLAVAVKHIFVVQGVMDITKGAIAVQKALAAAYAAEAAAATIAGAATGKFALSIAALQAAAGPLTIAIGAAVAAFYAGKWIIDQFIPSVSDLEEEQRKQVDAMMAVVAAHEAFNERAAMSNDIQMERIGYLQTEAEKEAALRDILNERAAAEGLAAQAMQQAQSGKFAPESAAAALDQAVIAMEKQKKAADGVLASEQRQLDTATAKNKSAIELIKIRERELSQAKEALKAEEDKKRSLQASLGLLDRGDQRRLQRALAAAESGSATNKQLRDLQQLGGAEGQRIVEHLAAPMGKAMADAIQRAAVSITGSNPQQEANEEFQRRQAALNEATNGRTPEAAISELQSQNDELKNTFAQAQSELLEVVRTALDDIERLKLEQSRQRQAARGRK